MVRLRILCEELVVKKQGESPQTQRWRRLVEALPLQRMETSRKRKADMHADMHAASLLTHTHTHTKKNAQPRIPSSIALALIPHKHTHKHTKHTHKHKQTTRENALSLSLSPRLSTFLSTSLPTLSRIMPVTKHDNELDGPSTRIIADGTEVQHARLNVHVARPRACAG